MGWNEFYLKMAIFASTKSKDPSTKCGAVIVGEDNQVLSIGFNGLPRGCRDDLPERNERPEKYFWYEHAERNAIYNAARSGINICGSKMYITGPPCMDCARAVVQSGIKEVHWKKPSPDYLSRWEEHYKRSLELFSEVLIPVYEHQEDNTWYLINKKEILGVYIDEAKNNRSL